MKLCISNIAWETDEDDAVGAVLRRNGVSAVEVAPTKYWPAPCRPSVLEIADLRKRWEDRGQRVAALQSLLFGMPHLSIFGDGAVRKATLDYLEGMLEIAAQLGAGPLVFGSPKNRIKGDRPFERAVTDSADFFRPLARRAADLGVVIAFEPNPTDYHCDFANTVTEALCVVEAVDHPGFLLNLDVGIMNLNGENAAESVALCRTRLAHVHLSEPQLAAVPAGSHDHRPVMKALQEHGWEGLVSIEMRAGADDRNLERVALAVEHGASLRRPTSVRR